MNRSRTRSLLLPTHTSHSSSGLGRRGLPRWRRARSVIGGNAADDVDDITAACQDPEITRWTSIPSPYPREFAELFVSLQDQWRREGSGYHFAIVDVSGGRLSGSIGLDAVLDPPAEIGYWIAPWARRPT